MKITKIMNKNKKLSYNIYIIILLLLLLFIVFFILYNIYFNKYESYNSYNNYNEYILPKIIYTYWDNLESNKLIQSHYNNWKSKIPSDWKLIILNKNNVNNYVSNNFLNRYNKLDSTRFSDFLRLELLKNNGGVWVDASIIIINSNFLDKYWNEMNKYKYDATLYEFKSKLIDKNIPYLENWFIMAPKNSKLIIDLYIEFDKAYKMGFLQYKQKILIPSNVVLDNTLGYYNKIYLMQHAIMNYLFHIGNKYNVNIKDAQESMFKIHSLVKWNDIEIINYIMNNQNWNNYYAIKLTKSNRRGIIFQDTYIDKISII